MQNKILIVGPAWVGDMIMSQTLYKLLKKNDPTCHLDVLAPAWTFPLLERMPEINKAIPVPFEHGDLKFRTRYELAQTLKENNYHQAIVLPNSFKSALIPWFAGIPLRTGWLGEFRHVVLNDIRKLDKKRYPLMIEQFMALGLPYNATIPLPYPHPSLNVSANSQSDTLTKLALARPYKPVLALCPGAEFGPSKRWPIEYFAEVAKQKINENWDVWLFGSQKDKALNDNLIEQSKRSCENLAGRIELNETIDLLSLATCVVTNDSGLMHLAAALDKPLVGIYGSTSPGFTPPLSTNADILQLNLECQPCFKRRCPLNHHQCMRDLKPEKVLSAIAKWTG